MCKKKFCFCFIKLSWKCFFIKEFKWKICMNCNFTDFTIKHSVFSVKKYVLNKNQSGGLATSHST